MFHLNVHDGVHINSTMYILQNNVKIGMYIRTLFWITLHMSVPQINISYIYIDVYKINQNDVQMEVYISIRI